MALTEREDGLFEDEDGRLFREVVEIEVLLDDATATKLDAMSERTGLSASDLCQAALVDRLLRDGGKAGDGDEA